MAKTIKFCEQLAGIGSSVIHKFNRLKEISFEVLEAFYRYEHFVILGHQKPDADCAASQLALALALERLNKSVQLVSFGPFLRPEINMLAAGFSDKIERQKVIEFGVDKTLAIILDCSTAERTGFKEDLQDLQLLVIDHHSSGESEGNLFYCDPNSPSTSVLVHKILLQLPLFLFQMAPQQYEYLVRPRPNGGNRFHCIDQKIACILFLGFAADTGFFRFLKPENAGDMLRLVSNLADTGINLQDIYQHMTGGRLLGTRRILGLLLLRAGFLLNARLCVSYELLADKEYWNAEGSDNDSFYSLLLATQNCEVIVFIGELETGRWGVGLRSLKQHDVGSVAARFGGGGHKNAAGCRLEVASLREALQVTLQELTEFWELGVSERREIQEYIDLVPQFEVGQFYRDIT